jgi:LysR family nitrogen assimilation transcriptional regulator
MPVRHDAATGAMRQTPDLRQLECFVAVARAGSINAAAQGLHMGQPALSRRMHALEAELGRQLLHRSRQGVTLTEAGDRLLRAAAEVIAAHERLAEEMLPGQDDTLLRLGATGSASELILDGLVAGLARVRPGVRVDVVEGNAGALKRGVQDGSLDLAIASWTDVGDDLHLTPLWQEALHLVGPTDHPITFDALADLPFLLASREPAFRRTLEAAFRRAGRSLNVALQVEGVRGARPLIAAGRAWSILPWLSIAADAQSGAVATASLDLWLGRALLCRAAEVDRPLQKLVPTLIRAGLERRAEQSDWLRLAPP